MFRAAIVILILLPAIGAGGAVPDGEAPQDIDARIDALVAAAYQAASARLPCKIGTTGKARMMKWQDVGKCLDRAIATVDWDEFARRLRDLRPPDVSEGDFEQAVDRALSRQALPFDKVFQVKDDRALLPLSTPVLKYLPPDSLKSLPVFDHNGSQIGSFAGVYSYERTGGLTSANMYTMSLFQYVDLAGKIEVPSEKLLLDSYGVSWEKAMTQPGFRLPIKEPGTGDKRLQAESSQESSIPRFPRH